MGPACILSLEPRLFLGFPYLELRNNYKRVLSLVVSSFIDSQAGLVLWFVLALVLNSKKAYNCKANNVGQVYTP